MNKKIQEIMTKETVSVRLYKLDKKWLMDHRDSKRKGIADVLHEIIEFWDGGNPL